jgi:hypothetical protein
MYNIHQMVGWDRCANLECQAVLGIDHVTLTTTRHIRRFCTVDCIGEGQQAWRNVLFAQAEAPGEPIEDAVNSLYEMARDKTG